MPTPGSLRKASIRPSSDCTSDMAASFQWRRFSEKKRSAGADRSMATPHEWAVGEAGMASPGCSAQPLGPASERELHAARQAGHAGRELAHLLVGRSEEHTSELQSP